VPTLEWTWSLGTAEHDSTERVLQITALRCGNCGAAYEFVADETYPVVERDKMVLRVRTRDLKVH
jgi:hypothetical protein